MKKKSALFFLTVLFPLMILAQKPDKKRSGELYFSWGYNTEWYTRSDIHVEQPSLGNEFTLQNIKGHDHPGWNDRYFEQPVTIPQYNYRLGYFFNQKKNLGMELNFDHTKFILTDLQQVRLTGRLNNRAVDTTFVFSEAQGSYYYLNNGANFFLLNIVKRLEWIHTEKGNLRVDALMKLGIGPVWPHVKTGFFGNSNTPHFQFGGWNIGCEAVLRGTFFKYLYLEFANKLDYARYSGLKIYEGTARHAFGTYEVIFNLGLTFPVGKKME